jgi:hypothetical protein
MSEQGDEGCQQLKAVKELEGGVSRRLGPDMCGAEGLIVVRCDGILARGIVPPPLRSILRRPTHP